MLRMINTPQVLARVPFSKSRLYEEIKAGRFPSSIRCARRVAWPEYEVEEMLRAYVRSATEAELQALVQKLEAARVSEQEAAA